MILQRGRLSKKLGYAFDVDAGDSKLIFCKKPEYGPCASKIIMDQFQQLLVNIRVKVCKGTWCSLIALADKPHQEHVTNIDKSSGGCVFCIGN